MSNFSAIARTNYIQGNDGSGDVCSVQDQEFDFYSASSLKQQCAGRHVSPLEHIILILTQSLFLLLKAMCFVDKQQLPI